MKAAVPLPDRKLLALAGETVSGMPRIGMTAVLEGPAREDFQEPVHGVEFLGEETEHPGPALTFQYGNDQVLERWRRIRWEDRILRLEVTV